MRIINVSFYRAYCLEIGNNKNNQSTELSSPEHNGRKPSLDLNSANKELGPKPPEQGAWTKNPGTRNRKSEGL